MPKPTLDEIDLIIDQLLALVNKARGSKMTDNEIRVTRAIGKEHSRDDLEGQGGCSRGVRED
jgi:hypothetical protein